MEEVFVFCELGRTRIGRITSGIVALVVVGCSLSFFVEARLVFSERPPLGYDALLCFCRLA